MPRQQKPTEMCDASADEHYERGTARHFAPGEKLAAGNVLEPAVGTVKTPPSNSTQEASDLFGTPAQHPEPHRRHLITSRVVTAVAGVTGILSIIFAGVAMTLRTKRSLGGYEDLMGGIYVFLNGLVICESFFCVVAMATCFGLLFTRPHAVLIRKRGNGSLNCLCASAFLLFIFALYSFGISAGCAFDMVSISVPIVAAIVAVVRAGALLCFFVVLLQNRSVQPFDPLY